MRIDGLLYLFFCAMRLQAQQISIPLKPEALLLLKRGAFSPAGKSFTYYRSNEVNVSRSLTAINGRRFFGTDGEMPRYILARAVLVLDGHHYQLQVDRMYNPWFGDKAAHYPTARLFKLVKAGSRYTLRGMFSDGAGGYTAEWQITGRSAKRTVLTTDDTYFF